MSNHIFQQSEKEILDFLDVELLKLAPAAKIKEYVRSIDDVYEKRAILKVCRWDFESFDYLLSIFIDTVVNKVSFTKKVDCFKVLKRAVRDNFSGRQFPKEILERLFYLYRESYALGFAWTHI